jgi:hypothetical protein
MMTNILLGIVVATLVMAVVTPAHRINKYYSWVVPWVIVLTVCAVILGLVN